MNPRQAVQNAIRARLERTEGLWPLVAANQKADISPRDARIEFSPAGDFAREAALPGEAGERTRMYSGLVQCLLKMPVDTGTTESDRQADLIEARLTRGDGLTAAMTLEDGSQITILDCDLRPPRPPQEGFVQRPLLISYTVTVFFPAT